MFDLAWTEMLVVGAVALVVVGPDELPGVLRSLGKGMRAVKSTANDFRRHFDELLGEDDDVKRVKAELEEDGDFIADLQGKPQKTYRVDDLVDVSRVDSPATEVRKSSGNL